MPNETCALTSTLPKVSSNLDDFYAHCRAIAQNGGWILLADPDGQQIFNTKRPLGTPLPPLLGTPEMWETMASGKSRISNAFTATVDPQPQFSVYVPVIADGRVTHILAMTFPTRMLNELLAQQNLREHWTGSVIDRSGDLARHPRSEKTVGLRASPEILRRLTCRDRRRAEAQPNDAARRGMTRQILVIDDDAGVRETISRTLEGTPIR